jgi:hypothetical protein
MGKKIGKDIVSRETSDSILPQVSHDYTFEQSNFIWRNGRNVTDILDRNGPELVRYALMMATQHPDTKLGAKLGELLVKSVLPATKADKKRAHDRMFEEIKAFDEVTLQRLADGEVSADDLELVDGIYIVRQEDKPSEGVELGKPKPSRPAVVSPAPRGPRPVTGAL